MDHRCLPPNIAQQQTRRPVRGRDKRERMARLLRVERDLGLALGAARSLDDALDRILDAAFQIEGIDCGGVYLDDEATGGLNLVKHRGLPAWFVSQASHYATDSPQVRLVQAGTPVFGLAPPVPPDSVALLRRERLQGFAVVPVLHGGKAVAALNLASHVRARFSRQTRHALEAIAAQIGGVLARVRAEESLERSRQDFQVLFDLTEDFLFILGVDGRVLRTNPAAQRRLGYTAAELAALQVWDVHPPDRHEEVSRVFAAILAGAQRSHPIPLRTKRGDLIPVETVVSGGRWGGRDVLFGVSRDLTERERAEAQRRAEHAFRAALIDRTAEGLCVGHETAEFPYVAFTVWNDRMIELTGYTCEEINRLGWYQSLYPDPDLRARAAARMAAMREGRDIRGEEWEITRADGQRRVVSISTSLLATVSGRQVLALLLDVTERRRAAEVLERHRQVLERTVQERTAELESLNRALLQEIEERKRAEQTLRESEAKYRALIETTGTGFVILDDDGRVRDANREYVRLTGHRELADIRGRSVVEWTAPYDQARNQLEVRRCREQGGVRNLEVDYLHPDGSTVPVEINATVIESSTGRKILGLCRDITERRAALGAIEERSRLTALGSAVGLALNSTAPLPALLQQCAEAVVRHLGAALARIWILDPAAQVLELQAGAGLSCPLDGGYRRIPVGHLRIGRVAVERRPWLTNALPSEPSVTDPEWARREGLTAFAGCPILLEDQALGVLEVFAREPLTGFALQALEGVADHLALGTQRKRAEATLRASLQEKEILLKELHHRVKNNLQIMSSLLSLEAARHQHSAVVQSLRDAQARLRSMALLHEMLYKSSTLLAPEFGQHVETLCAHLFRCFGPVSPRIRVECRVGNLQPGIERLVPCGLIVHELVSNGLKHAFPDGRSGRILVESRPAPGGGMTLEIDDDGVGLPPGLVIPSPQSLGLQLVFRLADQVGATVEVERHQGTRFRVTFAARPDTGPHAPTGAGLLEP